MTDSTLTVDYKPAQAHFLDPTRFGFDINKHLAIVIHKTGGDATPQDTVNTFLATGKSVHYVVGQDGTVWQLVAESRGAGGNCCPDDSHLPIWDPIIAACTLPDGTMNLNFGTISIEHCDPAGDNSTPLTQVQAIQSFRLVWYLMQKYAIDMEHVLGHNTINATVCPGNYPWPDLHQYVKNASTPTPVVPPITPPWQGLVDTITADVERLAKDVAALVAALKGN